MKMSHIRIGRGCVVGADAVVLYDTRMEDGAKLGELSLLMKGETLPAGTSWAGSPAQPVSPAPAPALSAVSATNVDLTIGTMPASLKHT